jgi:hypothetical protein
MLALLASAAAVVLVAVGLSARNWSAVPPDQRTPPAKRAANVAAVKATANAPPAHEKKPAVTPLTIVLDSPDARRSASGALVFPAGKRVRFRLRVSRDAYVGLWHVDEQGKILQLFPNRFQSEAFVRADRAAVIPDDDKYTITAVASTGPEKLVAFASTELWQPPAPRQHRGPADAYPTFETLAETDSLWSSIKRGLEFGPNRPAEKIRPPASVTVEVPCRVLPSPGSD